MFSVSVSNPIDFDLRPIVVDRGYRNSASNLPTKWNVYRKFILLKFFNKNKEVLKEIFEDFYQPPAPIDDESKKGQKFEIRVFSKQKLEFT